MFAVSNDGSDKQTTLRMIESLLLQAGYVLRPSNRPHCHDVISLLDGEILWENCAFDDVAELRANAVA